MKRQSGKVYSYLRFSDPKQPRGSSAERQADYAAKWAAKHGLTLDESLSLRDEGLSAFHQKHIKNGALGVFLRAVEDGRVVPGSVLVVESLDRLSRAEPIVAQSQLTGIVMAGIKVVTASDGIEYSRETVKENPGILFMALGTMLRANEESETKSKRVRASLRRQAQGWIDGSFRGIIHAGTDPNWVRADRKAKRFELIPERVEAVLMAIDLFRAGFGLVRIARALDESGLVLSETAKSQIKSVRNLFRLEALFGRRTVTIGGDETYTLEGYYPAVIKVEEFAEIQKLLRERIRQGSKSPISAIVTGLGITVCGHCTQMIVAQNNHSKSLDERGRPTETYRKLLCNSYHKALACKSRGSIPAPLIERSVMECCADEFNLAHLMEADPKHDALSGRLSTIRQEIAKLERRRDNFVDAIGDEDDKTLIAGLKKKHREASALIIEKEQSAALLEHEIAKVGVGGSIATVDLWQSLIDGVRSLDDDVRMKTRKLIADTFERIELYRDGFGADRKGAIDMLLVSKRGASVVLRIDCETKTWRAERIDRTKITSIAEAVGSVASERIAKRHAARTAAR